MIYQENNGGEKKPPFFVRICWKRHPYQGPLSGGEKPAVCFCSYLLKGHPYQAPFRVHAERGLFLARKEREAMKKLLTLAETSQFTNRGLKALRQLMYRKKFPFTKVGGRVFVAEEELEKFLSLSRKTTAEEAAGKEAA